MDLRTALVQGTSLLEEARVPAARLTAEVLLCHALRCERTHLYCHPEDELSELGWIHFGRYLHERMQGKPTQYITKRQEFFGRDFLVNPDVLIPRPETEHVVSAVLERVSPNSAVVDVGCGSGAIAITVALESRMHVFATDISLAALRVAGTNAARLGAANLQFACCDLLTAVAPNSVDIVVSNPPYVGLNEADGLQREVRQYEPHVALFAGETGMLLYQRLVEDAQRALRRGGWLVLELGWKSLEPVRALFGHRWSEIATVPDLAGIPRVLCARLAA